MQSLTGTDRAVLVIAPQWVGDAIVSLPLIHQLKQEYAHVDVLATPGVAAVYACSTDVRLVRTEPFQHGALQLGLRLRVARSIRGQYHAAVVLPNSWKSALIPWLARLSLRRGMVGEYRYGLLNDRRQPPRSAPQGPGAKTSRPAMLLHYLSLADQPPTADQVDPFNQHKPRMCVGKAFTEKLAGLASAHGLLSLCPGAEYGPAKQWPEEKFAEVACAWLAMRADHHVAIIGGPKDQEKAANILALIQASPQSAVASSRVTDLTGKTSLMEAFAWIQASRAVVSNDSGLMHAAAALDTPVIAIFGSTDPHHTPPNSNQALVVSLGLACSPCFKRICPLGTTACLRDIPAQKVITLLEPFRLTSQ